MADTNTSQHNNILKGYNMLLYFAGTMIMYEPAEECIIDFWTNGIIKKLPVSSANPMFVKAASQLRESCSEKEISSKTMIEDYSRLFSGDSAQAPLYESLYINNKQSVPGSKSPEVTEFYDSYGWKSKFRSRVKDDHLGVELLFLTILLEKYMVLDDEACSREMGYEIRRFIKEHILSWIPAWHLRVQKLSDTQSYKGISSLIYACIQDIDSILGNSADLRHLPGHLKN